MRPTETIALRREPGHVIRSLVALLLRCGLGMIFLMAGLDKLRDMNALPPAVQEELEAPADATDAPPEGEAVVEGDEPAAVAEEPAVAEAPEEPTEGATAEAEAPARYPETIRGMFAGTWIERELGPALDLHTALLPYLELGVGALLILGLFTTLWAFVTGLLLLSLLFGLIVLGNADMIPNMLIYLLVDAAILWLSPVTSNYLSLDGLLFGWFWKPKDEGEYRREYEAPAPRA